MRSYWDERARQNAMWYVDTSLHYEDPDADRFWETGREVVDQLVERAPIRSGGRGQAVEIGCGLGRICVALADHYDRVVGVDISQEMVDRARAVVTHPAVSFEVGDGASLAPLDDASTDLVVSFTVFQHIPDPQVIAAYVGEAARVLRPDGVFAFQWNSQAGSLRWSARRRVLSWLQDRGIRPEQRERNAAEFLGSRVPVKTMRTMLDRAGLELVETSGDGTLFTWAWARPRA